MSARSCGLGWLIAVASAGNLCWTETCAAQDLGKFLEQKVRQELRHVITPEPSTSNRTRPGAQSASRIPAHAEPHAIKTRDGWNLVALRYRPTVAPRPGAMPIILCHGLTYNALFWDLDPSCSFPRYLAGLGCDVWVVNLRGCGLSQKWVWSLDEAPDALIDSALRQATRGKLGGKGYVSVDPKFAQWTLDDHIAYDVPALVSLVRRGTGAGEVAWVGHSMGGIVAIAHLARYRNPGIGRLATVGSQVTMPKGQLVQQYINGMLNLRQKQLDGQPARDDVVAMAQTGVYNMFFNVENVRPQIYQALTGPATDIPAIGLMLQYRALGDRGVLLDSRGQYNYAKALGNITIPVFFSCGAVDQFAPQQVQQYLYKHVGSTDKTLRIFGRGQGMSVDAGHDDALVGLNSRQEVYPVIAGWLLDPARIAANPPSQPAAR